MFRLRTALCLALLPVLAFAQDQPSRPDLLPSPGRVLFEAVPPQADLVVHTASLPALLDSASVLGDAAPWSDAFRAQLRDWGAFSAEPARMEEAGRGVLAAMDGEVLLYAMSVPEGHTRVRSFLFAFRTSRRARELNPLLRTLVETGFRERYLGEARAQEIQQRRVIALQGVHERLYVHVQDGLVVVSDHALTLGLYFRSLADQADRKPNTTAGKLLLDVRYGRGDEQWSGSFYGDRENVSWTVADAGWTQPEAPLVLAEDAVVALSTRGLADVPVFPAGLPTWATGAAAAAGDGPFCTALLRDGGFQISAALPAGAGAVPESLRAAFAPATVRAFGTAWAAFPPATKATGSEKARTVLGGARRHGWLRALAAGRLPMPLPGVSRERLLGPVTAATKTTDDAEWLEWSAPDRPGALHGPSWHGPATFLALRTLTYIGHGIDPRKTESGGAAVRPTRTGGAAVAPTPPIGEGRAPLPPPINPREVEPPIPPPPPAKKDGDDGTKKGD